MSKQKRTWDALFTVIMAVLCLLWIYPIVLILLNSLKTEGSFTTSTVFRLPTADTFAGLSNYVYGVVKMNIDTDTQYAFSRAIAGHMFRNYDAVLKIDGEVGNKKLYDPRSWGREAETAMAQRVVEACKQLGSAGRALN